jgi:hypothetical protein
MASTKQTQITFRVRPQSAMERARDERMFRVLILLTSVFFLPVALLRKLVNIGSPVVAGETKLSLFADAKGMASTIIPFIFMG